MHRSTYPVPKELRLIAAGIYLLIAIILFGIHVATGEMIFPDTQQQSATASEANNHGQAPGGADDLAGSEDDED